MGRNVKARASIVGVAAARAAEMPTKTLITELSLAACQAEVDTIKKMGAAMLVKPKTYDVLLIIFLDLVS
jgi:hypothetical protein